MSGVPKRSDMRELVRRLDDLFTALGYKTMPQGHRLTVEDTALLTDPAMSSVRIVSQTYVTVTGGDIAR